MSGERNQRLLTHIPPGSRGIEIGGYYAPVAARRDGFRTVHLDVYDEIALSQRAGEDPLIADADQSQIEAVDLVGSAGDIADLVRAKYGDEQFDFVLSSHNLEHLPDPIRFLQGCLQVLRPGGVLSMALPDSRYCFDFYRSRTEVGEWLEAHVEGRARPTPAQIFQWVASESHVRDSGVWGEWEGEFPTPVRDIAQAYALFEDRIAHPESYLDAHCWVFTPASFRLLIEDLRRLDLHQFDLISVSDPSGCEFVVQLRAPDPGSPAFDADAYLARRPELLRDMMLETWAAGRPFTGGSLRRLRGRIGRCLQRWPRLRAVIRRLLVR